MYDALSPLQQYMFQQLTVLHDSTSSTGDKAAAISGLGERQEPWMRKSHPHHAQREIYRPAMVVYCLCTACVLLHTPTIILRTRVARPSHFVPP